MNTDFVLFIVQIIAAAGVVISVIYLGIQIHQQNEITKASFGHSLTQRLYDRYFNTTKDAEFSEFLSKDWASDDLTPTDTWRINHFIIMCLVDLFVDKKHLDIRVNSLRLGVMKSDAGKAIWDYMKINRDYKFIKWFEYEIYERDFVITEEARERSKGLNTIRD